MEEGIDRIRDHMFEHQHRSKVLIKYNDSKQRQREHVEDLNAVYMSRLRGEVSTMVLEALEVCTGTLADPDDLNSLNVVS